MSMKIDNYTNSLIDMYNTQTDNTSERTSKLEGKLLGENMDKCRDMLWPDKLQVLLFICKSTIDKTKGWWLDIHEEQLDNLETCALIPLDGTHYLHWSNAERMAEEVENFISFNAESIIFE